MLTVVSQGYIWHHRSNATQQWLFHFMYGGVEGFFVRRWVVDFIIKQHVRTAWIPVTLCLIGKRVRE